MQQIIRIEAPCDQNWDQMKPNDNGRHCASCCKTVVDFTDWPLELIAQYLQEKGKGNVCGHFRANQLNTPFETQEALANKVWQAAIPLYRKIAALIILFFAVTISSCNTHTTGTPEQQPVTQKDRPALPDTGKLHFDGTASIAPVPSYLMDRGADTKTTNREGTPKHKKYKKQQTVDTIQAEATPDPGEPHFQGAPELVRDTYRVRQNIVPAPDSTNK